MAYVHLHERCTEMVFTDRSGYHRSRCGRRGVVTEEGKLWCRQHSPSSVAARRAKQNATWTARAKARDEANDRSEQAERRGAYAMQACEAFCKPGTFFDEVRALARIALGLDPLPPKPKTCRECYNDYTPKPETGDDGFCSDACDAAFWGGSEEGADNE